MTVPRKEIFIPTEVGHYHCISRCVRRAHLCGFDRLTGRSFNHRREWIRKRLAFLGNLFSMEIVSYSLMTNHIHTLLRNRPDIVTDWSDREVAIRWRKLYPIKKKIRMNREPTEEEISAITINPELVKTYRDRLCNISWFNRCLSEHIARRANIEDKCTGRFWEGRFKCQRIEDFAAILTCSVYIDLNPIRANISKTPETSNFTSIQDRIDQLQESKKLHRNFNLKTLKLVSIENLTGGSFTTQEYINLVDLTGRTIINNKGSISENLEPILKRLKINCEAWIDVSSNLNKRFRRIVGSAAALRLAAKRVNKSWFQGIGSAQRVFL